MVLIAAAFYPCHNIVIRRCSSCTILFEREAVVRDERIRMSENILLFILLYFCFIYIFNWFPLA